MQAWPQPPPPRRNHTLPILISVAALFGFIVLVGVGVWFGLNSAHRAVQVEAKRRPERFTSRPVGTSGWYACRFLDMGLTMELPAKPRKLTYEPGEDPGRFTYVKDFAAYESTTPEVQAYLAEYLYVGSYEGMERTLIEQTLGEISERRGYGKVKRSPTVETRLGPHAGSEGSVSFEWAGAKYVTRTAAYCTGDRSFQLIVQGEPAQTDTAFERIVRSLKDDHSQ